MIDWCRMAAERGGQEFIEEVQRFLAEALTEDLRRAGRHTTGVYSDINACRIWHDRLFRKGWIAPAWPREFGGTGWTPRQRLVFEQECARNDAPILFATGLRSIGPLIIAFGTAQQKTRYLPAVLSGEDLWCQGFSESGAGSDLAALTTRAALDGEEYVITGRKLWTTGAHIANRMFLLVRTSISARRQDGVTFLLVDMATPGILIRPIVSIDGEHEFDEVVFENARIPAENRVGSEGDGWNMAKQLMRFARSNNTTSALVQRTLRAVERAVVLQAGVEDHVLRRLTQARIDLTALQALELRLLESGHFSGTGEEGPSLLKVTATELHQRISELLVDVAGPYCGARSIPDDVRTPLVASGSYGIRKYLATRAATIYSGTNEIHRNILFKHLTQYGGVSCAAE